MLDKLGLNVETERVDLDQTCLMILGQHSQIVSRNGCSGLARYEHECFWRQVILVSDFWTPGRRCKRPDDFKRLLANGCHVCHGEDPRNGINHDSASSVAMRAGLALCERSVPLCPTKSKPPSVSGRGLDSSFFPTSLEKPQAKPRPS